MIIYQRTKLPYKLNDLEPIIYFKTMYYHYEILHKNYETKLNECLQNTGIEKKYPSLAELMENLDNLPAELKEEVRFFGGGLINHNFFFFYLTKMNDNSEKNISLSLLELLEKKYGNLEKLKKELLKNALAVRGSGWTWLVLDHTDNLIIINTANQDGPWSLKLRPLIAIDVWEHAYYLDYGANRKEYVEKLLQHCLHWENISKLYLQYKLCS